MVIRMEAKPVRGRYLLDIKSKVEGIKEEYGLAPTLAVVVVGEREDSATYIRNKMRACIQVGIGSSHSSFDADVARSELEDKIAELNERRDINGILVQLPIPHMSKEEQFYLLDNIDPLKDVDGFTQKNLDRLLDGNPIFEPCTPKGVMALLEHYKIPLKDKRVVIAGASRVVGLPLSYMLINRGDCYVHLQNSTSLNREAEIEEADIFISAIGGKPHRFSEPDMIKQGAVLIDVGINHLELDGRKILVGDMNYEKLSPKASYMTPVPGGVGPMTVAMLMQNTLDAFYMQNKELFKDRD